jgi:hypothetical protein
MNGGINAKKIGWCILILAFSYLIVAKTSQWIFKSPQVMKEPRPLERTLSVTAGKWTLIAPASEGLYFTNAPPYLGLKLVYSGPGPVKCPKIVVLLKYNRAGDELLVRESSPEFRIENDEKDQKVFKILIDDALPPDFQKWPDPFLPVGNYLNDITVKIEDGITLEVDRVPLRVRRFYD